MELGGWTIDDDGIEKPGLFEIKPSGTYMISSSNFKVDSRKITASSIDLSGELAAEGVVATFGFFGDRLSVGGTQGSNVIISKVEKYHLLDFL